MDRQIIQLDRWTDKQIYIQLDRHKNGETYKWKDIQMDRHMIGQKYRMTDTQMDKYRDRKILIKTD
jgi:hypothetical protein